jgi:hypothetical protein
VSLGPAALVRSLPGALRRDPADELLLVGVSELSAEAAAIYILGLDGTDTEEGADEVASSVHHMISGLVHDKATRVVVVVYTDTLSADSTAARLGATAAVAAEAAGLGVLDAIAVANGRWRSYECDNPSCCPPEGNPITEGPTP